MARTDIYLNINATSPANAVVASQTSMVAADVPELVLGDAPTFNFYFTDGTNVFPTWAGNAAYSFQWALGLATGWDENPLALQTDASALTGGWQSVLPLNAGALVEFSRNARISQEYPVLRLWQHVRVVDPTGYAVSYAQIRTNVRLRSYPTTVGAIDDPLPAGTQQMLANAAGAVQTPGNFLAANLLLTTTNEKTVSNKTLQGTRSTDPDFAMVFLPDSGVLTLNDNNAAVINAQVQWAVTNKTAENVKAVVCLGDMTNAALTTEYARMVTALGLAKTAGIPVVPLLGNHDYDSDAYPTRNTTVFNTYFGPTYFSGLSYYIGSYPALTNDNYYIRFTNGATTWIVLALECVPQTVTMTWAQGIIEANPTAIIILATHYFLDTLGRIQYQDLYDQIVKPYSNVRLAPCGHFLGPPHCARSSLVSTTTGRPAHLLYMNYQDQVATSHYMLILRFSPAAGTITGSYYSPTLAQNDPSNPSFVLPYNPIIEDDSSTVRQDLFVGRNLQVGGTLRLGENALTLAHDLTTEGNNAIVLVSTAPTDITLPAAGTLATLAGTESLSNKSFTTTVGINDPVSLEHIRLGGRFTWVGATSLYLSNNAYYAGGGAWKRILAAAASRLTFNADGTIQYHAEATGSPDDVLPFTTPVFQFAQDNSFAWAGLAITIGADNSAGTGYRLLRVPNA